MPAISRAAFARAVRSLDDAELAAFVADLWAARGFETAVDGSTILASHPDRPGRERLVIGPGRAGPATDQVIDISRGPPPELDDGVLGVQDLRERLLYAVDRETAGRLAERHLGRSLVAEPGATPLRYRLHDRPTRQLLTVGVVAVLAVGLVLGVSGGAGPFDDGTVPTASKPVTPSTMPVPFNATPPTSMRADDDRERAAGQYPPGLGPSGLTSIEALADAHEAGLAHGRWELRIVHDGSVDLLHPFGRWATVEQTVVRTSATRYRFDVDGVAKIADDSVATVSYVDYGDGTANYRHEAGSTGSRFLRTKLPTGGPPGVFATASSAYVYRYLATTESRVERVHHDGEPSLLVVATGSPTVMTRPVANYTATATVDRHGVVRRLSVEYTLLRRTDVTDPDGSVALDATGDGVPREPVATVRFEMVLTDLGTATLDAPRWYEQARNATDATMLPTWPNHPSL